MFSTPVQTRRPGCRSGASSKPLRTSRRWLWAPRWAATITTSCKPRLRSEERQAVCLVPRCVVATPFVNVVPQYGLLGLSSPAPWAFTATCLWMHSIYFPSIWMTAQSISSAYLPGTRLALVAFRASRGRAKSSLKRNLLQENSPHLFLSIAGDRRQRKSSRLVVRRTLRVRLPVPLSSVRTHGCSHKEYCTGTKCAEQSQSSNAGLSHPACQPHLHAPNG
jgi:hypothetical protein